MVIEDKEKSLLFFDEGFPDRVLKTSFFLSLIIVICSLSYMSLMITVSVAIGCFVSLILYKILWWTIQHAIQHKRSEIKKFFLKISIVKYFIVGAILLSICLFLEVNIIALMLGLSIVIAVIILKIGSKLLVNYMNRSIKVSFKDFNS